MSATTVRQDVALLYRRAGFGLRPSEFDAAAAEGYETAVDRLLAGLRAGPAPEPADMTLPGLQQWWLQLMASSSSPLQEKLTLFWHGHFATAAGKVRDMRLMYMQNQLFRTAGGGSFEDLMQAVAKDGAMMIWLDTVADKKAHPNENFAREMMELFTLGIGNYTQADVTAGARSFTGWSYDRSAYRYVFRARQHDFGEKEYLGTTGDWDGDDAVRIAVHRDASAPFLLASLWSHFAYPVTSADPIVRDLLPAYASSLDVSAALRNLFLHPAFRSTASRSGLVKQPAEYVASAIRALGAPADPAVTRYCARLGQSLFQPPNVGGWGQNAYWLDTATAQARLEFAVALAQGSDLSAVTAAPAAGRLAAVAEILSVDGWGPTTLAALKSVAGEPPVLVALALTSPEFVLA